LIVLGLGLSYLVMIAWYLDCSPVLWITFRPGFVPFSRFFGLFLPGICSVLSVFRSFPTWDLYRSLGFSVFSYLGFVPFSRFFGQFLPGICTFLVFFRSLLTRNLYLSLGFSVSSFPGFVPFSRFRGLYLLK
jgi:hypothetical protein